jgi:hypothetical protein
MATVNVEALAAMQFQVAAKGSRSSPEATARAVALAVLSRLFRDGECSTAAVQEDVAHLTKRADVVMGCGISNQGGLNLHRSGGQVELLRDNALIIYHRVGKTAFEGWLAEQGITLDQFGEWLTGLEAKPPQQ